MGKRSEPLRILVVDDDESFMKAIVAILRVRGFNALGAKDAYDACILAEGFKPQAMISDVFMPGMNGVQLATFFAKRHPECRTLLISGDPDASTVANGSSEPRSVLAKPIHAEQILDFADSCMDPQQPSAVM